MTNDKIYDVSSLYPAILTGKGHGKTHQVDRKYKTEINNKYGKVVKETREALHRTFPHTMKAEREKILDEVLKMLEKEVHLLNRKHLPHLTFGLKHAILIVKDLKK